jgi:23S rRNA (uracil1939-C5)-methyltransferase
VLAGVRSELERHDVPAFDERSGTGWLRYLIVRSSRWKHAAQVILVARDRELPGLRTLARGIARVRGVGGVVLNLNPDPGNVIFGKSFVALGGSDVVVERIGGLELQSRPGAFLQANVGVARRVYERVLELAHPAAGETAIDLYAGVGAISFCLATGAARVFGIEESPLAVLDAKANIRRNGFHNVRFVAGPTGEALPDLAQKLDRVDLVTLNPPRRGADETTRRAIVACRPSRIVYVSCDPETLARDLAWFASNGYAPRAVEPFDMLPQTDHVECVALLVERANRSTFVDEGVA